MPHPPNGGCGDQRDPSMLRSFPASFLLLSSLSARILLASLSLFSCFSLALGPVGSEAGGLFASSINGEG